MSVPKRFKTKSQKKSIKLSNKSFIKSNPIYLLERTSGFAYPTKKKRLNHNVLNYAIKR